MLDISSKTILTPNNSYNNENIFPYCLYHYVTRYSQSIHKQKNIRVIYVVVQNM